MHFTLPGPQAGFRRHCLRNRPPFEFSRHRLENLRKPEISGQWLRNRLLNDSWFRVDLLFFHRRLKCLLVIDLKIGKFSKFSHADAGQMHMYLNYAREHWMKPGENPPVGLILCASKGSNEAHYALEGLPNKVLAAEYQTVLPDEKMLAEELEKTRRELDSRMIARGSDVEGSV
ncbi:PDDEXK nuclease domain-containing protein [Pseudoduganella albidiflava]|nr:PDDEXK nuclease domain-containing protein [Pseudoduganella albidiflava]